MSPFKGQGGGEKRKFLCYRLNRFCVPVRIRIGADWNPTREDSIREREVEKQFKALQQEIALTGEEMETLRREQRAGMDALRLEVEALRQCLVRLRPDFKECYAAVRDKVMHETDPEAL